MTWLHTQQHGAVWLTAREGAMDVIVGLCNQGGIIGDTEYKRRSPRLVTYKSACRSTMLAISKESLDLAFVNHRDPLRRFQAAAEVSLVFLPFSRHTSDASSCRTFPVLFTPRF